MDAQSLLVLYSNQIPGFSNGSIFDGFLNEIEQNNTTLAALKKHAEASKLSSKTGIYLQNPEIGFNYLWGSPGEIGTRTDFNVMQTFDFPSSYHFRGNIADLRMEQADLEYRTQRADILYEARLVCIDLVYYYALLRENEIRMEYAKNIAEAMDALFEGGKISILELPGTMQHESLDGTMREHET